MKTFSVYNVIMIVFASFMCVGSLKLGFGSFSDPGAGFMPFLSGIFVILLSLFDLAFSAFTRWKTDKKDDEIWSNVRWGRFLSTLAMLIIYGILMPILGFSVPTVFLLFVLFRLIERRPIWRTALLAVCVTGIFYIGFGYALGAQLPRGILGF
jgi:putative tricarboxylic transport membrane protein